MPLDRRPISTGMARRGLDFVDLVSSGQMLQHLLFACPDGVIVANANDDVVLFTGASERLFGFAPIDVMHRPVVRLFEDCAGYIAFRGALCADGAVSSQQLSARTASGATFVASVSAASLRERDGTSLGVIFYIRDCSRLSGVRRPAGERGAA